MRIVVKRGNDQIISLMGLKSTDDNIYLNSATVTASLRDYRGNVVPPFEEVPMAYVTGSDGNYEWFIDSIDSMLPKGVEYQLEIKAEQAGVNYRTVHVVSVVDA